MNTINIAIIDAMGSDARDGMEWDRPYERVDTTHCTFCRPPNVGIGMVSVKVMWPHHPKGHILTRCPEHWGATP